MQLERMVPWPQMRRLWARVARLVVENFIATWTKVNMQDIACLAVFHICYYMIEPAL